MVNDYLVAMLSTYLQICTVDNWFTFCLYMSVQKTKKLCFHGVFKSERLVILVILAGYSAINYD